MSALQLHAGKLRFGVRIPGEQLDQHHGTGLLRLQFDFGGRNISDLGRWSLRPEHPHFVDLDYGNSIRSGERLIPIFFYQPFGA